MIEDAFCKEGDELYRKNVGIILTNKENKIFVGKRFGVNKLMNSWQMPQGGIAEGESEEEALLREVKEEVGILPNAFNILAKTKGYYYYVIPKKMRKSVWNSIYVGQKQRWFLASFEAGDDDVNISTEFPEFEYWEWQTPAEIVENAISFKKEVYIGVLKEFKLLNEGF